MVYFIQQAVTEAVKIGSSNRDPVVRLKQLQTASPYSLTLLLLLDGLGAVEEHLHTKFRHLRIRGEWFRSDPTLLEFVENPQGFTALPLLEVRSSPALGSGAKWLPEQFPHRIPLALDDELFAGLQEISERMSLSLSVTARVLLAKTLRRPRTEAEDRNDLVKDLMRRLEEWRDQS